MDSTQHKMGLIWTRIKVGLIHGFNSAQNGFDLDSTQSGFDSWMQLKVFDLHSNRFFWGHSRLVFEASKC
ncbi:hypothetical protein CsSME_00032579 [Camellia sinensis var. sinensis]